MKYSIAIYFRFVYNNDLNDIELSIKNGVYDKSELNYPNVYTYILLFQLGPLAPIVAM